MIVSDQDKCALITALFSASHDLAGLWTPTGPSPEAVALLDAARRGEAGISHGAEILLRVGFDVWGAHGKATVADLLGVLDDRNYLAVLLVLAQARDLDTKLQAVLNRPT